MSLAIVPYSGVLNSPGNFSSSSSSIPILAYSVISDSPNLGTPCLLACQRALQQCSTKCNDIGWHDEQRFGACLRACDILMASCTKSCASSDDERDASSKTLQSKVQRLASNLDLLKLYKTS